MAFKECKYGCHTEIQWDTSSSSFKEHDGRLHDRTRCEGLRPERGGTSTGTSTNQTLLEVLAKLGKIENDVSFIKETLFGRNEQPKESQQ